MACKWKAFPERRCDDSISFKNPSHRIIFWSGGYC